MSHQRDRLFVGEVNAPCPIYPLVFTAEDVERAAKALRDDKANRAEYYHVPEWADTPYGDKLVYRSAARAVLGAVGEVEQELREAVTDEIRSVVAAFSDSQMEALLTGDLVAAHERVTVLTHSKETHSE